MRFNTTIDSRGRISLPQPVQRQLGNRSLELTSRSERHLLLTAAEDGGELVLAGVLGDLNITDLLSFFNMFRKTGVLRFELSGGDKHLFFQQGEIVNATSTFPEEDLGEVLFGLGKIDRNALLKIRSVRADRAPLGKLLVEKGAITARDLWLASRQQAETIVYNLFSFLDGGFSFLQRELEKEEVLRLSMSTQNLIMEGLRRVDERALFMRRIGSLEVIPMLTGKPAEGSTAATQKLLSLVAEGGSVRETVRRSGLGEFDGLRILYQLVERGVVATEEAPSVAVEGDLGEIVSIFNSALGALFRRIAANNPQFRQQMQFFLRDLPQPFSYVFREVELREDGTVDGGRLLANLSGLEEGDKKKLLADSLSELIYMECHAARKELGTAESTEMVRRVQEVSRRVKALTGRTE